MEITMETAAVVEKLFSTLDKFKDEISAKITEQIKATSNVEISVERLSSAVKVLSTEVDGKVEALATEMGHKAEAGYVDRIVKEEFKSHETVCAVNRGQNKDSNSGGFWSGLGPSQKSAIVVLLVTNAMQVAENIFQWT